MINWFKKLDDAAKDAESQHNANMAQLHASRARNAATEAEIARSDAQFMGEIFLEIKRRNEESQNSLEDELEQAYRLINTLRDANYVLNAVIDGQHAALVRATGDVAQLTGLSPEVVSGRYKLAVIDCMQYHCAVKDDSGYESLWKEGIGIVNKIKSMILQSEHVKSLRNSGMSQEDAIRKVEEKSGLPAMGLNGGYYWIDFNADILNVDTAHEALNVYKEVDDGVVRIINAQSRLVNPGSPLTPSDSQRADGIYGCLREKGAIVKPSMHQDAERLGMEWSWKIATGLNRYKELIRATIEHINADLGFDLRSKNAVKK